MPSFGCRFSYGMARVICLSLCFVGDAAAKFAEIHNRVADVLTNATVSDAQHGPDDHHADESIFRLQLEFLDVPKFWGIVLGMLVFTLMVDRVQWCVTLKASTQRCNRMFVERVISELMLFGTVSISVFCISQFATMSEHTHYLFEFADVLSSLGAVALIILGGICFLIRTRFDRSLVALVPLHMEEILEKLERISDINELGYETVISLRNAVQRNQFFVLHRLNKHTFSWELFLVESLNQEICDLVNINWKTWVVCCIFTGVNACARATMGNLEDWVHFDHPQLICYLIYTWLCFLLNIANLVMFKQTRAALYAKLRIDSVEGLRASVKEAHEVNKAMDEGRELPPIAQGRHLSVALERLADKGRYLVQGAQVLALGVCFSLGFYVMHIIYNISAFPHDNPLLWHLAFVFPIVTGLFVMTPLMMVEAAMIQSFCDPSHDVMDSVVEQVHEEITDLAFIKMQMEAAAAKGGQKDNVRKFAIDIFKASDVQHDGTVSYSEFQSALSKIGCKVSQERAKRVFDWTSREYGECTYEEIVAELLKA